MSMGANLERLRLRTARRKASVDKSRDRLGPWADYEGLWYTSTALSHLQVTPSPRPAVKLLLPSTDPSTVFAGLRTAIAAAVEAAKMADADLHVIDFGAPRSGSTVRAFRRLFVGDLRVPAERLKVSSVWDPGGLSSSPRDIWIATYWSTAHSLQVAVAAGRIDPSRVLYFVQDYEPAFFAASTESALAHATYGAGFEMLINSQPLYNFMQEEAHIKLDHRNVFRPEFDIPVMEAAITSRSEDASRRVLFYGRPSKPRNSYALGLASLKIVARRMRGAPIEFISVGEAHRPAALGEGTVLRSIGRLSWADYFTRVANATVVLGLQQTPHPSHVPLDAALTGGFAVTNEVGESRRHLSHRLRATSPDPSLLADALVEFLNRSEEISHRELDYGLVEQLGSPLRHVVQAVSSRVWES